MFLLKFAFMGALYSIEDRPVWEIAVHLAVACDVYDGVFCAVLFPTRCLG